MRKKETWIIGIAMVFAILLQICDPFTAVVLLLCIGLSSLFSFGLLISSVFLGKKSFKWGLIAATPFLFTFAVTSTCRHYKHRKAEIVIGRLEKFKKLNGRYPVNLLNATNISLKGMDYEAIDNYRAYRIEYLMDGFNREYFDSELNEWGTRGWND